MDKIVTPDELLKAEQLTVHNTPAGEVTFVVPSTSAPLISIPLDPLTKSYVKAHYRHSPNGKLVFVGGYHNEVMKQPDEIGGGNKPPVEVKPTDKFTSYHYGDDVFVKYSHMHDQHFLVGAVVGIRDDFHHNGKLVAVRLLNGKTEWYAPHSLVHVSKQEHDKREHEVSHHKDDKGNTIDYKHLDDKQKVQFMDIYRLWFALQRMGEVLSFQKNKEFFKRPDGSYPSLKSDLNAEQKLFLEANNPFPVVPYEAIIHLVSSPEYNDGQHTASVKNLLEEVKKMKAEGAPEIQMPKLYKPKSKKENPYVSPMWLSGMFPSVETDEKPDKDEYNKLQYEIGQVTKLGTSMPSTEGTMYGNSVDFHYGKPIKNHGVVPEAQPEGVVYPPAPKIPTIEQATEVNFSQLFSEEEEKPTKKEAKQASEQKPELEPITPVVPIESPKIAAEEKETEKQIAVEHGEEPDISDLNFKVIANAKQHGFGGTHSKYILEADDGHKYLFKPFQKEEGHRVWAEIIPSKLAEIVGLPAAKFGSKPISLKIPHEFGDSYAGQAATGSVQRIADNIKANTIAQYANNGFKDAPQELIEHLQREHVLDWLVGNHDSHQDQFIQRDNGDYMGVDKGQSFKYYGSDHLDITYDPNYNKKLHEQVYNILLRSASEGHIKLDYGVTSNFINQVQDRLSSLSLSKIVLPYAAFSVNWAKQPHKFRNLATKRLAELSYDFKNLYKSLGLPTEYDASSKSYKAAAAVAKQKLPETDTYQPDAFMNIDGHFHAAVIKSGPRGKSILMGGGTVEDMNVVYTPYEWDNAAQKSGKGKGLEVSMKIMAGAEPNIVGYFDTVEDQNVNYTNHHGTLSANDPIGGVMMEFAKTVNNHAMKGGKQPDGLYNPTKSSAFAKWFQTTDNDPNAKFDPQKPLISTSELALKLSSKFITDKHFDDPLTLAHQVATKYMADAKEVMAAVSSGSKTSSSDGTTKHITPWTGPYKMKNASVSKSKHPYASYPFLYLDQNSGKLIRKIGEKKPVWQNEKEVGVMFTKDLPGNIQVRYYPHHSSSLGQQNNLRSQQGQLIMDFHNWDGDIESMHKSRQIMKQMGLDHKLATHTDLEVLYLSRIAWQQKADVTSSSKWKKIQGMKNDEEKVKALTKLCAEIYGADPTTLPTYDVTPKWDSSAGQHYFMNPYVLHYIQSEPKQVYYPTHTIITSTDSALRNIARLGLLSTENRLKYGLSHAGKSSENDQATGGASYVFTRGGVTKPGGESAFQNVMVFKPELAARTDWFSYSHDNFGSTNYGQEFDGKESIETRLPIMDVIQGKAQVNEAMYKHGVNMHPWLIALNPGGYGEWKDKFKKLVSYLKEFNPHSLNHVKIGG